MLEVVGAKFGALNHREFRGESFGRSPTGSIKTLGPSSTREALEKVTAPALCCSYTPRSFFFPLLLKSQTPEELLNMSAAQLLNPKAESRVRSPCIPS